MTLRKGESPGFYGTPSASTFRFVRTSCPTKTLWSFKATLHGVEANAAPFLVKKLRATGYEDSGLVFAKGKGTPLDAQNILNRHFKPLLKRAGLPPIRWHDLRHTCATLLLGRSVHPKLVQRLLGHASIAMTLDRYSHWIPSMGRHAADGMDEALG